MKLEMTLNGESVNWEIAGHERLLDLLRDKGYFSPKRGCENGECGACAVMVDGKTVCSCIYLAGLAQGRDVMTVEGLGTMEKPHALQEAFVELGAVQCGYCIPGMLLSAKELLDREPNPKEPEIRSSLEGHLCRCTGYMKQFEAVKLAAKRLQEPAKSRSKTKPKAKAKTGSGAAAKTAKGGGRK
jgi:carbon-monoxide dehydrogenase small subunit